MQFVFNPYTAKLELIADSASITAINATQIADGTVDNTEFQYLNGATSNIQTQLNTKIDVQTAIVTALIFG